MGITLSFSTNGPHNWAAPQSLAYTETINGASGSPVTNVSALGWNDSITVLPGASGTITPDFGSSSSLAIQTKIGQTVNGTATVHQFNASGTGGGTIAKMVGVGAIANAENALANELDITSMAAGRFGITAKGNTSGGGQLVLSEAIGVEILPPVFFGTVSLGSATVGLEVRDQGSTSNYAIKTNRGQVRFQDLVTIGVFGGATGIPLNVDATLSQPAVINFKSSGVTFSSVGRSVGFGFAIGAYDGAGNLIDNPITFVSNAGNPITINRQLKIGVAGNEATGAGSALLGANCPAVTVTAPYRWMKITTSDGSAGFIPVWK